MPKSSPLNADALQKQAAAFDNQESKTLTEAAASQRATDVRWNDVRQRSGDTGYTMHPPNELGLPDWPTPLAHSYYWMPQMLQLYAELDAEGLARLRLRHDDPRPCEYSKGPAPGRYLLGRAAIQLDGTWLGEDRLNRYTPAKWAPITPDLGTFDVYIEITRDDAVDIQALEEEHIADFKLAWDLSVGVVAEALARLPPARPVEALGHLVDELLGSGHAYVIPAVPDNLTKWGGRLKRVYSALADMSSKRDRSGKHNPLEYRFTLVGADADTDPFLFDNNQLDQVTVRYVCPDSVPRSSPIYIEPDPEVVKPEFTFSSYAEYRARKA